MAGLVESIDALYELAVSEPSSIDDAELARWLEDVAFGLEGRIEKTTARALRKAARNARRLARYWSDGDHDSGRLPDWRNGVDEVLGGAGWRPHLDLARAELAASPTATAFDEVKHWFRAVHFTEWMDGVTFEEWLETDERSV